jgi:two-component system response regulator HydG
MPRPTILICDDEDGILAYLKKLLTGQGFSVETFNRGSQLLERLASATDEDADLLLQDVKMPDIDGLQVLERVRSLRPGLPTVIMTAFGSIDMAVEAIKCGAYDYVTKPFPKEKILGIIDHALERQRLLAENQSLKDELGRGTDSAIIFKSRQFAMVYDLTLQVAASDANILILGESGTGKELIANTVHSNSNRRNRRFLSINCAALSDTLLESQLFGHVRGAFTGAVASQKGILEEADGGTLFLDEIGDMSLPIQAKLLRVIQEGEFIPVGTTRAKNADIRFVAATNKELQLEVAAGRFREDLYYRLNVISIPLPPLRERRDDIEPLANHFLQRFAGRMKKQLTGFSAEAMQLMTAYHWPGNIRELENVVERAVILARDSQVTAGVLPPLQPVTPTTIPEAADLTNPLRSMEMVEREHIQRVLTSTGFHKSRSAEILGISRKTLDRKIDEYRLDVGRALRPAWEA